MHVHSNSERFDVVVIGGGQAGLSVGYCLARQGRSFVILDASARVGDAWRQRWHSLRLFTPARFDGLVGMPFPAHPHSFPTKDEMANYLEAYARRFELPVRSGVKVERLRRDGKRYVIEAGSQRYEADHVVVAMSSYQAPKLPAFARDLNPDVVQMHSSDYRSPQQLGEGPVLVVGGGNSGAEIAFELVRSHRVVMSGRDTGHVPFRVDSALARVLLPILFRVVFHRVLTVKTPMGRRARSNMISKGLPLIRVKPRDLAAAGIERVPRVAGVQNGLPVLDNGRILDVGNVIWCTGFHGGFSWIDLPIVAADGEPLHESGVVPGEPGLYFVGLHFLHSASSTMIHGIARDAERIAGAIDMRIRSTAVRAPALATA